MTAPASSKSNLPPDLRRLVIDIEGSCPCCLGIRQEWCVGDMGWEGVSICKCGPDLKHDHPPLDQECRWIGHAAIDALAAALARMHEALDMIAEDCEEQIHDDPTVVRERMWAATARAALKEPPRG